MDGGRLRDPKLSGSWVFAPWTSRQPTTSILISFWSFRKHSDVHKSRAFSASIDATLTTFMDKICDFVAPQPQPFAATYMFSNGTSDISDILAIRACICVAHFSQPVIIHVSVQVLSFNQHCEKCRSHWNSHLTRLSAAGAFTTKDGRNTTYRIGPGCIKQMHDSHACILRSAHHVPGDVSNCAAHTCVLLDAGQDWW